MCKEKLDGGRGNFIFANFAPRLKKFTRAKAKGRKFDGDRSPHSTHILVIICLKAHFYVHHKTCTQHKLLFLLSLCNDFYMFLNTHLHVYNLNIQFTFFTRIKKLLGRLFYTIIKRNTSRLILKLV